MGLDGDGKLLALVGDTGKFSPAPMLDEGYLRQSLATAACPAAELAPAIMRFEPP